MLRASVKTILGAAIAALVPASLVHAGPIFFLQNGQGGWNAYELEGGQVDEVTAFNSAASRTFPGAESVAPSAVQGHVVTIRSQAQNDQLFGVKEKNFGAGSTIWIGLSSDGTLVPGAGPATNTSGLPDPAQGQEPVSGQRGFGFKWQSAEPFTYHNWAGGEPNNYGTGETGAEMRGDGLWNDNGPPSQPALAHQYIVEYNLNLPSRPQSIAGLPQGGAGTFGVRVIKGAGTMNNIRDAQAAIRNGSGTAFNSTASVINYKDPDAAGGAGAGFGATRAVFPGDAPGDDDDFALVATGRIHIATEDDYTFGFSGDDGSSLRIIGATFNSKTGGTGVVGDTLQFDGPTGDSNTLGVAHLTPGDYDLEYEFFERAGGAFTELYAAEGVFTDRANTAFHLIGDTANGGLPLVAVPEPSCMALLGIGAAAMLRRRKRA
jgi:hypothetical protein